MSSIALLATLALWSGTIEPAVGVYVPVLGTPIASGSANLEDLAVGDFDCDGDDDIAAPAHDGQVMVAHRRGDAFVASARASGRSFLRAAASGDFDADGCDDLAAVDSFSPGYTVALLGRAGGLVPAPGSPLATALVPWGVAVGDLNADGRDDLVTAEASNDLAYVFLASPGGGFAPASTFALGRNSVHVELADLDGNQAPDLVASNHNAASLTLLLNSGAGSFAPAPASPLAVGLTPCRPVVVDLDADGRQDIIVRLGELSQIAVYRGGPGGTFQSALVLDTGLPFGCAQFAVADLDGNGRLDLAIPAGDRIRHLYQRTDGSFRKLWSERFAGFDFTGFTVHDFDADGAPDLVAGARLDGESLLFVLGQALFASRFE